MTKADGYINLDLYFKDYRDANKQYFIDHVHSYRVLLAMSPNLFDTYTDGGVCVYDALRSVPDSNYIAAIKVLGRRSRDKPTDDYFAAYCFTILDIMPWKDRDQLKNYANEYDLYYDEIKREIRSVSRNGMNLQFCKHINHNMCYLAVMQNAKAVYFVPRNRKDINYYTIYERALRRNKNVAGYVMSDVVNIDPSDTYYKHLCYALIDRCPTNIKLIPDAHLTPAMCQNAVYGDYEAMPLIPERFVDLDFCKRAVKRNVKSLKYIPARYIDELAEMAVARDASAIMYLLNATRELKIKAIWKNPHVIRRLPQLDRELCMEAVRRDGTIIRYVPEEFIDGEMCITAIKSNKYAVFHIKKFTNLVLKQMVLKMV